MHLQLFSELQKRPHLNSPTLVYFSFLPTLIQLVQQLSELLLDFLSRSDDFFPLPSAALTVNIMLPIY